jgi:aminoglycoside phosphotransferase (APT) family kinase protein
MARARQALAEAGLDPSVELHRTSSVTNEVWLTDQHVIRVSRHPNGRLQRESRLAPVLPAELRYPEVIGCDTGTGFDWLIVARRPGVVLSRQWPTMAPAQRRFAVRQLAFMLMALHQTPNPPGLGALDSAPQLLSSEPGMEPIAPLLDALAEMSMLEHVDEELVAAARSFVWKRADVLKPFDATTLVHGDITFENVLWDGEQITALIDFEWARAAPADVDLDVLLRFCAYPFLHVAADYEALTHAEDYEEVPAWLAEDYPALFSKPHRLERMQLFSISYDVRELLLAPPTAPARDLPEHHALRRLVRTLTERSYLDSFELGLRQLPS